MFDVWLVTHKNMMTTSGTNLQGLHSTQVRHHTQIDLLTCRVCFVKHMMIRTQVRRHHTHLDLTTWYVCAVKHMMIMRQYFSWLWHDPYPLHARGLGLCLYFGALVCDLLPRRLFDGFCQRFLPKVNCPKSISGTILSSNAWEDTGLIWCLSYPSGGAPLIPGHYVSW